MKSLQEAEAKRLVRALDREIRSRGRGTIRVMERALDYSEGWWQHRRDAGTLALHQLFQVLDHLGLDPAGFVRKALCRDDDLELDRPRGTPPPLVLRAWERFQDEAAGTGLGRTYLDTLDEQRYQEPGEVLQQASWAVEHVELELLPQLLGVAGSTYRLLNGFDEAEHAIQSGIKMADQCGARSTLGRLLQRLSYVVADQGDRRDALRISEKAAVLYLRSGDHDALAMATVDQGIWLYYLQRFEESIEAHRTALSQLPSDAHHNRCTAYQYLGLNRRELGNLEEALEHLHTAEQIAVEADIGTWAQSKLTWLRARITTDLGDLDQAEYLFTSVVDAFRNLDPVEAALATCELVRVYLMQDRPADAYETAVSMRALVEPLRHYKIISVAIRDLLDAGQAGLTFALIKHVMAQIEGERQNKKTWQSLIPDRPRH